MEISVLSWIMYGVQSQQRNSEQLDNLFSDMIMLEAHTSPLMCSFQTSWAKVSSSCRHNIICGGDRNQGTSSMIPKEAFQEIYKRNTIRQLYTLRVFSVDAPWEVHFSRVCRRGCCSQLWVAVLHAPTLMSCFITDPRVAGPLAGLKCLALWAKVTFLSRKLLTQTLIVQLKAD